MIAGPDDDEGGGERFGDLMGGDTVRLDRDHLAKRAAPRPRAGVRTRDDGSRRDRFRFPDGDDRHRAADASVSDAQLAALGRGEPEPEERIDLHGARLEAAGRLLARRIANARGRGLRAVLVIHGQGQRSPGGEAVLRDALPDWLTDGPASAAVLAFAPAPDRLGGRGATVVLLRR